MSWEENYRRWLSEPTLNFALKNELQKIKNKAILADQFYRHLEFGTGGMRAEIGVGTNRMNIYAVRRVTLALAQYILLQGKEAKASGVAISYDSRLYAKEFAEEAATVLANSGIKVYLSDTLRPTPLLSFAVRQFKAAAGIMITASHNPASYNGYKIYRNDGCQITVEVTAQLANILSHITNELKPLAISFASAKAQGLVAYFGEELEEEYLKRLRQVVQCPDLLRKHGQQLKLVYTPLHGAGLNIVQKSLRSFGITEVIIPEGQSLPDGRFPTVPVPNPEEGEAFRVAIQVGKEQNADLLLATDPDADRLGAAIRDVRGDYQIINGNQLGVLLLHYLLMTKKGQGIQLEDKVLAKTIVTSDLGQEIATSFGVKTYNTLTGFKFIGEKIAKLEQTRHEQFIFGYEESCGYLVEPFVRDKDAIQAVVLITEVALYYKQRGKNLLEVLEMLYKQYGYYLEVLINISFKGQIAEKEMAEKLEILRQNPPTNMANVPIVKIEDYLLGKVQYVQTAVEEVISLPVSNVLKYYLADGSWCCIRPSGTESKCKIYLSVHSTDYQTSQMRIAKLQEAVNTLFAKDENL